jgi:hypothetical protein
VRRCATFYVTVLAFLESAPRPVSPPTAKPSHSQFFFWLSRSFPHCRLSSRNNVPTRPPSPGFLTRKHNRLLLLHIWICLSSRWPNILIHTPSSRHLTAFAKDTSNVRSHQLVPYHCSPFVMISSIFKDVRLATSA